jgi:hypothetical protein
MAATVRAVFEIGFAEDFGSKQGRSFEKNAKQAAIDRPDPVARQARLPGFGQVRGASGG